MASARLTALRKQWTDTKAGIEAIKSRAAAETRDLSDEEQTETDTLYSRAEALSAEIEKEGAREDMLTAGDAILAKHGITTPTPAKSRAAGDKPEPISFADHVRGLYFAKYAKGEAQEWGAQLVSRAELTTADNPGIIPVPIVGPLINFQDLRRPVLSSMTSRPHPGTKSWTRPELYQHVAVGVQSAELVALDSQEFKITGDTVTSETYGGFLKISEQDIDFTDPSAMQILLDDFRGRYAKRTEAVACTALEALATATATYTATNFETVVNSYVQAAEAIYTSIEEDADTVWLARDVWAALAGSLTELEQPLIKVLQDALTQQGSNLRFVRAPGLTAGTRIIGSSKYVEAYERDKGFVQGVDVSHLGIDVAYRGYLAIWGVERAFVSLEP